MRGYCGFGCQRCCGFGKIYYTGRFHLFAFVLLFLLKKKFCVGIFDRLKGHFTKYQPAVGMERFQANPWLIIYPKLMTQFSFLNLNSGRRVFLIEILSFLAAVYRYTIFKNLFVGLDCLHTFRSLYNYVIIKATKLVFYFQVGIRLDSLLASSCKPVSTISPLEVVRIQR